MVSVRQAGRQAVMVSVRQAGRQAVMVSVSQSVSPLVVDQCAYHSHRAVVFDVPFTCWCGRWLWVTTPLPWGAQGFALPERVQQAGTWPCAA
jgi:hypothetical protein